MNGIEDEYAQGVTAPRTVTVLGVLVGAGFLFSWLGAYAFAGALVSAEVLPGWGAGQDPRPRWMGYLFVSVLTLFLGVGAGFRWLSQRQLRSIDAISEE